MRVAIVVVLIAACSSPKPPEPLVGRGEPVGSSVPVKPAAPQRLELVEGTPTTLADGTIVNVKNVGYAHMTESRNLSNAMLVLTRDGQTVEVGLAREHGSNPDKAPPGDGLGWRFVLEMADPYQRPSRAIVEATKL